EAPEQRSEPALLLLDAQEAARVGHRPRDLRPVADDAGVLHQLLDAGGSKARDARGLESVEGAAEPFALAQDDQPGEPGLESVEHQLLEERPRIAFGNAPLLVVVADVQGVARGPGAAGHGFMVARGKLC